MMDRNQVKLIENVLPLTLGIANAGGEYFEITVVERLLLRIVGF
jgi:hypothetical protein